jgi:hypothetical protein
MFPIRINLLPPRKKKRVATLVKFLFLKHIVETILFFVCLGGVTLLLGLYVLEINYNSFSENFIAVNSGDNKTLQETRKLNTTINQLSSSQKDFIPWSTILEDLTVITPPSITWKSWNFDGMENKALFSGFARNRTDLVTFGEELKKLPWVSASDIPLNDLVAAGESPFQVTVTLALDKLVY